jgi:hypothetical protein
MHSTKRLDPDYKQIGMAMNSALPAVTRNGLSQDGRELSDKCPYTSNQLTERNTQGISLGSHSHGLKQLIYYWPMNFFTQCFTNV